MSAWKSLQRLRDQLKVDFPDLQVVISEENDALLLSGRRLIPELPEHSARRSADRSSNLLPTGSRRSCPATRLEQDEVVQRLQQWSRNHRGGADRGDIRTSTGDDIGNLRLSTERANSTFVAMTAREPALVAHLNFRGQPVLSVAGYGKMRPVAGNDTPAGRATNRRIDLRIIMYTPSRSEEIDNIRKALRSADHRGAMSLFRKAEPACSLSAAQPSCSDQVGRSSARILSRWPDVVADPPERDRERLVTEMLRRLATGDWKGARMSFVTSAARALFDAERRSRPALERLRRFYCGEIEASDSRTFLAAMMSVYLGSYAPGATHTVALARSLAKVRQRLDTRSRLLVDEVPEVLDPHKGAEALGSLMIQMDDPWQGLRDLHLLEPPCTWNHGFRTPCLRRAFGFQARSTDRD